jgi:hypothetical protein
MAKKTTGSRLQLGEPLASDLADFCEAHYGAPEIRIIREALRLFIDAQLAAEPKTRKRFQAARDMRLAQSGGNVVVLPKKTNGDPK